MSHYPEPFSSVQLWYQCLEKAHMHSTPSSPALLLNSSNVCPIDDGPLSSFQGRLLSASSLYTSRPPESTVYKCDRAHTGQLSQFLQGQVVPCAPKLTVCKHEDIFPKISFPETLCIHVCTYKKFIDLKI